MPHPIARRALAALFFISLLSSSPNGLAGPVITEFLAQNDGGLRDEDGDSSDWIEVQNDGSVEVSLGGWHLTDDPANLVKWTFPDIDLSSAAYLIVFASGKDRAVAGLELHANFGLQEGGGYLALVEPDGTTVAQEIPYPAQRANVSFGVGRQVGSTTTLLSGGAAARLLVPSDGALGLTWTERGFEDAAWLATNTPVGFEAGALVEVLAVDFNERGAAGAGTTLAGFESFVIDSVGGASAIQSAATVRSYGSLTLTVEGVGATTRYDDRLRPTPANTGGFSESLLLQDFVFAFDQAGSGGLDVTVAGLAPGGGYVLTLWSFDSGSTGNRVSDWSANGVLVTNDYRFGGQTLPVSNEQYRFAFEVVADGAGRVLLSGRRDASSVDGAGGASFGVFLNALRIEDLTPVSTSEGLASLMVNSNATAYLRLPFEVLDPAAISRLNLRMNYNDGFIAYLNGQEFASANAPAAPLWNSSATAVHAASGFEEFGLILSPGRLLAGENVLAIHGLNVSAENLNFFLAAELVGEEASTLAARYFSPPTPGGDNDAGFVGLVADTKFSVDRGFYEGPFTVGITTATINAQIYWTTDGRAPSPSSGTLYAGPVPVTGTTYLRAAAFKAGLIPSDVDTHTYIFLDEVLAQPNSLPGFPTLWQANYPADYGMDPNVVNNPNYGPGLKEDLRAIPTLSLVMSHDDFWGASVGIYNHATSEGPIWERAVSAELIHPDGSTEFAVNCGVQMQGNASRDNNRTPKHNFRLMFKSIYGPSKLRYDWFGGVERFDNIVLRACFTDSWSTRFSPGSPLGARYRPEDATYLRDVWMKDSLTEMGQLSGGGGHVHLYVNGLYWGVYNPAERLDNSFFETHVGGPREAWDVIRDFSEVLDGNKNDWNQMIALVNSGIGSEAAYQRVADLVDIESLIDYMLLHFYGEAEDWPSHNWYAAHRRETNALPATKWIFLTWDQEIVADQDNARDRTDVSNNDTPAVIYSRLRAWPEFRRLFGDRVQKHLFNDGALTSSNSVRRFQERVSSIFDAMVGESARWGDAREFATPGNPATGRTFTRDEWWVPELDGLFTDWFPRQTGVTVTRLRADGLYPSVDSPQMEPYGGAVPAGFELVIIHPNLSGTIYFTTDGTDPRVYGSGAISSSAQAYSGAMVLNGPTRIRARVLMNSSWSALIEADFYPPQDFTVLALSEIMYHPPDQGGLLGAELEFLELKNRGLEVLDLTGIRFSEGINFAFTNGTLLGPGEFFVLGRNPAALAGFYPGLVVRGVYTGQLDNAGEPITLSHPVGSRLLSVNYNDAGRWPITADGFGFSLVGRDPGPSPDPSDPVNWRASSAPGGSPGADDPEPSVAGVIISEVLTHTDPPQVDFIELHNSSLGDVDVGGWFLSDDRLAPAKFRIPMGTVIEAGGYHVFTEADFNPTPGLGDSFTLSSEGEEVYLFAADAGGNLTGYNDGFNFGAAANGVSFGLHMTSTGEEQYPAQVVLSSNSPNAGPLVGPIVVNQIMYHPPDLAFGVDNSSEEYLELRNIGNEPVPLFNPAGQTWKLRDAVDYVFPSEVVVPVGGAFLVVSFDPTDEARAAVFLATYPMLSGLPIYGPYSGKLDNSSDRVELTRPDERDGTGQGPQILVERVHYRDRAPWPVGADGSGAVLKRVSLTGYGNDPANWVAEAALSIRSQPQDLSVEPGRSVSLSVAAIGSGVLGYQWYFNGMALGGATSEALTLVNVGEADQGYYSVEVSDVSGTIASQPAFMGVLVAPYEIVPPLSQSVVEGGSVTLSIVAGGHQPMGFRWRRGLTVLHEVLFSDTSFYTIDPVDMSHAGTYEVILTNAVSFLPGERSSMATLIVLEDSDGDGMPDEWETMNGLNPGDASDAELDKDGDGRTNREEYVAGTDAMDPGSLFEVEQISLGLDTVAIQFLAISEHTYSVLKTDSLGEVAAWTVVEDLPAHTTNRVATVIDFTPSSRSSVYRLVTPRMP